jgi:hypothetical protein
VHTWQALYHLYYAPSPRPCFLNTISQKKRGEEKKKRKVKNIEALDEMTSCGAEIGNEQDKPRTSYNSKK